MGLKKNRHYICPKCKIHWASLNSTLPPEEIMKLKSSIKGHYDCRAFMRSAERQGKVVSLSKVVKAEKNKGE